MKLLALVVVIFALFSQISLAGGCCSGGYGNPAMWVMLVPEDGHPRRVRSVYIDEAGDVSRIFDVHVEQTQVRFVLTFISVNSRMAFISFIMGRIRWNIYMLNGFPAVEMRVGFDRTRQAFERVHEWEPGIPEIGLPNLVAIPVNASDNGEAVRGVALDVDGNPLMMTRPRGYDSTVL